FKKGLTKRRKSCLMNETDEAEIKRQAHPQRAFVAENKANSGAGKWTVEGKMKGVSLSIF
ncbi:MAG: hypothetical protein RR867_08810, partial [Ruthenibacterium sp.]